MLPKSALYITTDPSVCKVPLENMVFSGIPDKTITICSKRPETFRAASVNSVGLPTYPAADCSTKTGGSNGGVAVKKKK